MSQNKIHLTRNKNKTNDDSARKSAPRIVGVSGNQDKINANASNFEEDENEDNEYCNMNGDEQDPMPSNECNAYISPETPPREWRMALDQILATLQDLNKRVISLESPKNNPETSDKPEENDMSYQATEEVDSIDGTI